MSAKIYKNLQIHVPIVTFGLIITAAIILRIYMLDDRPFHIDEVVEGLISYNLYKNNIYIYSPATHGPSLYYITALSFYIFGDSDFTARIIPSIFGIAIIFLLYPLRKVIGTAGYLITSIFIAFSPTFVYYSRFFRHDILFETFLLSTIVGLWLFITNRNNLYLIFIAISFGFLLSTKEESIIIAMAIILPFVVVYLIKTKNIISSFSTRKNLCWKIMSIFLIFFILTLMYSSFFQNLTGLNSFIKNSFLHWFQAQGANLFLKEQGYYFNIMLYERIIIGFGIVGSIFSIYRKNWFMIFISYWLLANFTMFSYYSYKMPWLLLHILTPSVILAGYGINEIIKETKISDNINKHESIAIRALLATVLILFGGAMLYNTIQLNFYNYATPTYYDNAQGRKIIEGEFLIEGGQPTKELIDANKFLLSLIDSNSSEKLIFWDAPGQFGWYFRNYKYNPINEFPANPIFFENKIIVTNPVSGEKILKYLNDSDLNYTTKYFNIYSHLGGNVFIIYNIKSGNNIRTLQTKSPAKELNITTD